MALSLGIPTLNRALYSRPDGTNGGSPPATATGSESASIGPRQTEALLPTVLRPVGVRSPDQEVSGNQEEAQPKRADQLREAAEKANKYLSLSDTYLEFIVSEQTGHVVVHVVNSETKEIVREVPPETLTKIADRSSQLQGLLFEAQV